MLVITMPLGGITGGTQTILAFNYGAGQPDRVKKAQRFIFLLSAGYTTILFILAQTAGHLFVRLFTSDPALIAEAAKTIKIYTPGSDPLKHPVCDRRRLHWPWKGPALPALSLIHICPGNDGKAGRRRTQDHRRSPASRSDCGGGKGKDQRCDPGDETARRILTWKVYY